MPNIISTDDARFSEEVLETALPVFAMFKSEWCASCKRVTPVVEKLSDEYKDRLKFVLVDAVKNVKSSAENNVLAIPTLVMFKNGKETERVTGYFPEPELKAFIERNI